MWQIMIVTRISCFLNGGVYHMIKNLSFSELSAHSLYDILRARFNVFVIEQNCIYQECDDLDYLAQHLMMTDENNQLVAYARCIIDCPDTLYPVIGRVLVVAKERGKGLGRKIIQAAISYIFSRSEATSIAISAQAHLCTYYKKIGFRVVSTPYDDAGISHVNMLLDEDVWQKIK